MKILIADDELRLRKVIALYMSKCSHEVIEAGNGDAAIEMIYANKPDAVVLDIMMPGKTGIEVTKIIRENPEYQDMPIILLTANASEDDVKNGIAAGANKYITKPFSPKELAEAIESLMK